MGGIFEIRSHITAALELKRAEKFIGSSLQAAVTLALPTTTHGDADWSEICITSAVNIVSGSDIAVEVQLANGAKCERCWKITPEVKVEHPLCNRCDEAVKGVAG